MTRWLAVAVLVGMATLPGSARAADTWEHYGLGNTSYETYLGFDGIGEHRYQRTAWAAVALGYGLGTRLSGYLTLGGSANEYFADGQVDVSATLFWTPVDTDHFDCDLFLSLGFDSAGGFSVMPWTELNFDLDPKMASWGAYLRLGERVSGLNESIPDDPLTPLQNEAVPRYRHVLTTWWLLGTYWTVRTGHQLLLEYDMSFTANPPAGTRRITVGGIVLAYNVTLNDWSELATQVTFDIPQRGERFAVGLMVGLLVTLPESKRAPPAAKPARPPPRPGARP